MKRKRGKKELKHEFRNDYLKKAVEHLEGLKEEKAKGKDEAATYTDSWAVSYRKLNGEQQLFAKKAIEEILIMGQLGQLTINTVSASSSSRDSTPSYAPTTSPQPNYIFLTSSEGQHCNVIE